MTDLAAWLREQLDEDERLARAAGSTATGEIARWGVPCGWPAEGDELAHNGDPCECCRIEGDNITIYDEGGHDREQALHIARWDPARVLAEVEAKRRIIAEHVWSTRFAGPARFCPVCETEPPCRTLRLLSSPYADCPGYQPEWVPEHDGSDVSYLSDAGPGSAPTPQ